MAEEVEQYIAKNKHWEKALRLLRGMCRDTELDEDFKWGAPIYTLDGKNVVGILAFKSYIGLWFHQGVFMEDKYGLLEQSSETTKGLRKMTFNTVNEIEVNESHILEYIREAVENQNAGKEIEFDRNRELVIPSELQQALDADDQLQKAFNKITPGKRREYAEYILSAKQLATKERRIEKISKMILNGVGLNDKYK